MGSVFRGVFGGDKKTSSSQEKSWNEAYPFLQEQFGSITGQAGQANNSLAALLGLGGDTEGQMKAFDNYRDSAGYNFVKDEGINALTGSNAAKGLLQSGATARGVTQLGTNLASTFLGDYMDRLSGLTSTGIQAGAVLGDAGKRSEGSSTSKGTSKPGISKFLGAAISGGASGGGG